jgi:hypothetical protein
VISIVREAWRNSSRAGQRVEEASKWVKVKKVFEIGLKQTMDLDIWR